MITCNLESAKVLVLSHFLSAFLLALIACLISLFNQGTRCLLMNVFFFKGGGGAGGCQGGKAWKLSDDVNSHKLEKSVRPHHLRHDCNHDMILRNLAEKDFACI